MARTCCCNCRRGRRQTPEPDAGDIDADRAPENVRSLTTAVRHFPECQLAGNGQRSVNGMSLPPRRVRVAANVYQRVDARTGERVPDKFEFTYRDATRRQIWQTAKGNTKEDAIA
jgi:hypothetical protein